MKMKPVFFGIDATRDASLMGNALQNAVNEGMDPQVFLKAMANNSLRPWVDPEDPFNQYVSIATGMNADGTPKYESVYAGNADNMTMLKGEWEVIDSEVIGVAQSEMRIVNMLMAAGLRIPLDGMGVNRFTWNRMNKFGEARIDMDMTAETNDDRAEFDENSIPVPIVSSGWTLNMRQLAMSRKTGQPLDTIKAYMAAYAVAVKTEDLFLNGAGTFKSNGNSIYGLRNTPAALSETITTDWGDDTVDGEMIVDEVNQWVQTLKNQKHNGPFTLYLPQRLEYKLTKDYKKESDKVITTRILEGVKSIKSIEFLETLNLDPEDSTKYNVEAFLVELKKQTIAVLDGMDLTNFQWQKKGPFVMEHKIAQIKVPLFRNDIEGQTGLLRAKGVSIAIP